MWPLNFSILSQTKSANGLDHRYDQLPSCQARPLQAESTRDRDNDIYVNINQSQKNREENIILSEHYFFSDIDCNNRNYKNFTILTYNFA